MLYFWRAGTLEPTYRQLQTMKLDKSPFVIISVIGQELLAQAKYNAAVLVLESALKIGTCSLKLRGSVFSALSSAYWALNSLDKVNSVHVVCDIPFISQHIFIFAPKSDLKREKMIFLISYDGADPLPGGSQNLIFHNKPMRTFHRGVVCLTDNL